MYRTSLCLQQIMHTAHLRRRRWWNVAHVSLQLMGLTRVGYWPIVWDPKRNDPATAEAHRAGSNGRAGCQDLHPPCAEGFGEPARWTRTYHGEPWRQVHRNLPTSTSVSNGWSVNGSDHCWVACPYCGNLPRGVGGPCDPGRWRWRTHAPIKLGSSPRRCVR